MNTLRDHLQAIRDEFGRLDAELVADLAAAEDHPLHGAIYDKPLEEAARAYYVGKAAQLLRVTFRPDPSKPIELRAFIAIRGEESHKADYVPLHEVIANPMTAKLMLRSMERDWMTFERRYDHMSEFVRFVQSKLKAKGKAAS